MHRIATATSILALALLAVVPAGQAFEVVSRSQPHLAQGLHFPPAWYGVWEITEDYKDCVTEEVLDSFTEPDSICSNSTLDFDAAVEGFGECTYSIDDTNIDIQCSGSYEIFPGCTAVITLTFQVTRAGDSFTGREMFTITLDGDCQDVEEYCELWDYTASRTSGTESCPSVAANSGSWGHIKQLYR